jgi:hypothetical protein
MKFCHLQVNGWNWRISSEVSSAKLRKPRAAFFLSYVEYKPNTNTSNIMKNRSHLGGHIQEREDKKRKLRR